MSDSSSQITSKGSDATALPAPDTVLDVTGLLCPLPVLKARKSLSAMQGGEVLQVNATDPAAVIDIPHFCQETGHRLAAQDQQGDLYRFWIVHR
ncbi:MAG: sulfurtransferase TusA family protein [Pseudomonadota bacterium]